MAPRSRNNNVYGQLITPEGLRPVLRAVERAAGPGCASVFRDRAGGAERLRLRSDAADLETLPLAGGAEHLFNGAVGGSAEDVVAFVRGLSRHLAEEHVEHSFEVYDAGERRSHSIP